MSLLLNLTFFAIVVLCAILLLFEENAISLRQCFLVFCILFFGIAGYVQIRFDFELAPMFLDLHPEDYFKANCIIIASIILYETVYRAVNPKRVANIHVLQSDTILMAKSVNVLILLTVVGFIHLYLENFSIVNLVLRGGDGTRVETNQMIGLLLNSRKFSFMAIAFFYFISKNKNRYLCIILLLIFIFFCLPTSEARLRILPFYLPLIAILFPSLLRKRLFFSFAIFGGAVLLFPVLGLARKSTTQASLFYEDYSYSFYNIFSSLDFDSYKSLVNVIYRGTISNGRQLLGCILFWVPRNIWPSKPIGSGAFIAQKYDLGIGDFDNVSMNFLGEGYINFGLLGVIMFVVVLAYISASFDKYVWITKRGDINNPIMIYYLSTNGYLFFLLRGDLLSGIAFYCGMIAYILFTERFCFRRIVCPSAQDNQAQNSQITTEHSPYVAE